MSNLALLDLFSGIGGFPRAAELAGVKFDRHYYSEIEPYACRVYAKNFPNAIPLGDIRSIDCAKLPKAKWIVCGGFPCQDLSFAGRGAGLSGTRSGLWWEMHRVVTELQPEVVIVENVPALANRGLDRVLLSLAEVGFDAEWDVISAADCGAPHLRERLWIVAYPALHGRRDDPKSLPLQAGANLGDGRQSNGSAHCSSAWTYWRRSLARQHKVLPKSYAGRSHDGVSAQLDRVRALGNAIVPQVAATIFSRLRELKLAAPASATAA